MGLPLSPKITDVSDAYDSVAASYDAWKWQDVWTSNEMPIVRHLVASLGARTFVDVGTGTGRYFGLFRREGLAGVGVDISSAMLEIAARKYGGDSLIRADARSLPFRSQSFDVVIAARILSHVPDIDNAITELGRVTSRSGYLVLTDVAGEHRYSSTSIDTPNGSVVVPTHKRTAVDMISAAARSGWSLAERHDLRATNSRCLPSEHVIGSIDRSGVAPYGYVLLFERASSRNAS